MNLNCKIHNLFPSPNACADMPSLKIIDQGTYNHEMRMLKWAELWFSLIKVPKQERKLGR